MWEKLWSYLVGYGALAALVGTRVYALRLPQHPTLPAVRYQVVSRRPVHIKTGVNLPLVALRVQFDVIGASYASVDGVAIVLKTALYAYTNTGPTVFRVMIESEQDVDEAERNGQVRRVIDAMVWCHEEES